MEVTKPRGRVSPWACFIKAERARKISEGTQVINTDLFRECAAKWKVMSESDKKVYVEQAEVDKVRFDKEMKDYSSRKRNSPEVESKRRAKKRRKDPNAPKRNLSGYFWFCTDKRPKIIAENPGKPVGVIAKVLGEMWSKIDPETKKKYENMAAKDRARYAKEMEAYKKGKLWPEDVTKKNQEEESDMEGEEVD